MLGGRRAGLGLPEPVAMPTLGRAPGPWLWGRGAVQTLLREGPRELLQATPELPTLLAGSRGQPCPGEPRAVCRVPLAHPS